MPERRYKGKRRWGMESEYPLIDSSGLTVIIESPQYAGPPSRSYHAGTAADPVFGDATA